MDTKDKAQQELARLQAEMRDFERVMSARTQRMRNRIDRINEILKQL